MLASHEEALRANIVGRGRGAKPSAVKANFKDTSGGSITVVEFQASQIKPTFLQVLHTLFRNDELLKEMLHDSPERGGAYLCVRHSNAQPV